MKDGYESGSGKGPRQSQRVDRAEQGDLLAEAVTGLFSQQIDLEIPEGPEKEAVGETAPVPEAEPMPDSLWEQKISF